LWIYLLFVCAVCALGSRETGDADWRCHYRAQLSKLSIEQLHCPVYHKYCDLQQLPVLATKMSEDNSNERPPMQQQGSPYEQDIIEMLKRNYLDGAPNRAENRHAFWDTQVSPWHEAEMRIRGAIIAWINQDC
jgi:hypothetical protein